MAHIKMQTSVTNPEISSVQDVMPQEVFERRQDLVLIDVRRPDEYTGELGHAPGSKLIVLDQLPDQIGDLPKDKTIIFICRSGARSARAAAFAKDNGFTEVYNMKGGMILWNQLDLITEGKSR